VEIKAKVSPGVVGAGPCFLLWPASRDHWPPEVDILETSHGRGQFTNHWVGPNGNGDNRYDYTEFPLDPTQWHRYGLEWTPDRLTMTVDDKVMKTLTDHIPNEPMSVALQGYVGSAADTWYGGSPNASGVSLVGVDVDYVHVNQWVGD
jgi:beta-glucanase (GH16 family)